MLRLAFLLEKTTRTSIPSQRLEQWLFSTLHTMTRRDISQFMKNSKFKMAASQDPSILVKFHKSGLFHWQASIFEESQRSKSTFSFFFLIKSADWWVWNDRLRYGVGNVSLFISCICVEGSKSLGQGGTDQIGESSFPFVFCDRSRRLEMIMKQHRYGVVDQNAVNLRGQWRRHWKPSRLWWQIQLISAMIKTNIFDCRQGSIAAFGFGSGFSRVTDWWACRVTLGHHPRYGVDEGGI